MKSPVQFVVDHADQCPRCSFGDYCDDGRRLMQLAAKICRVLVDPIPPIPRSPYKA